MAVRIEKAGPVWTIIHDRPEARNAMDPDSADALTTAFLRAGGLGDVCGAIVGDRPGRARGDDQSQHQFSAQGPARAVLAAARLLKLGKRLAVGEVNLLSGTSPDPIAHAMSTYSIPNT